MMDESLMGEAGEGLARCFECGGPLQPVVIGFRSDDSGDPLYEDVCTNPACPMSEEVSASVDEGDEDSGD